MCLSVCLSCPIPSHPKKVSETENFAKQSDVGTPRPRAALLMCLKKYSAIGNSAIGDYVVLCSRLILKTVLLEVSYSRND